MQLDEPAAVTVGIVDDRVAMTADGDADIYVKTPEHQPLSAVEPHATIRVSGDGYRVAVELDADQARALAAALPDEEGDGR